eukprot:Nitzschia sp. Nitz4//scaffold4_size323378//320945//321460//NITZ4_000720-RA/size323378-processed-gene-0.395-mRNA-1//-1//CDS//3329553579//257//frame0
MYTNSIEQMLRISRKRLAPSLERTARERATNQQYSCSPEDEAEEQASVRNDSGVLRTNTGVGSHTNRQEQPFKRQRVEVERNLPGDSHLTTYASKERQVLKEIMQTPIPRKKVDRTKVSSHHEKKHRDTLHHFSAPQKLQEGSRPKAPWKQQVLTSVFDFVDEQSPMKRKR